MARASLKMLVCRIRPLYSMSFRRLSRHVAIHLDEDRRCHGVQIGVEAVRNADLAGAWIALRERGSVGLPLGHLPGGSGGSAMRTPSDFRPSRFCWCDGTGCEDCREVEIAQDLDVPENVSM